MKNLLNFFLEVEKLKTIPRTGWVWLEVRNPETIAEHTFRMTILTWLLGKKKNLNTEKIVKIALLHDLCEVHTGDLTPYYGLLPENKIKRKEILKRWVRLPKKEKEERAKIKFEIERKSFFKLIKFLKPDLQKEISSSWFSFEKGITKEGKFVRQVDKIETLIQAIEYFGTKENTPVIGWWEEVEELVDDPLLLRFLKVIQKKFYGRVVGSYKKQKELENILDFLLEIGKLKKMPRSGWVIRGIKNPETIGSHIFMFALMTWIFGREKKELNMEKLLEMALCHEICEIHAGDETPYDTILSKNKREKREILKKWIRFSREEKQRIFLKDYKKEKAALKKLTSKLQPAFNKEMIQLWDDFKKNSTLEAHFLNQLYVVKNLLQALQYWKKDKNFPIEAWWEEIFEVGENLMILEFMEELKKKFYKR